MQTEILIFEVDDKRLGVHSENVLEVVRAVKLSPLPNYSRTVEGLLNLRGRIVPVVDIRALFGFAPRQMCHSDHLIVVTSADRLVTLRVDRAAALESLTADKMQSAATILRDSRLVEWVAKAGPDIVHILSIEQLITLVDTAVSTVSHDDTEAAL